MSIVFIWNNNQITCSHRYPGHAALHITEKFQQYSHGVDGYVSWFPGGMDDDAKKRFASPNRNFLVDLQTEMGYVPDHILRLRDMNENAMVAKWNEIRNKPNAHYLDYRKNCATIVARVLKAGSNKGSFKRRHRFIWTPLEVKRLAHSMGGYPWTWEEFTRDFLYAQQAVNFGEYLSLNKLKQRDSRHGSSSGAQPNSRFTKGLDSGAVTIVVQGHVFGPYDPNA